jgi:hypothetical protein
MPRRKTRWTDANGSVRSDLRENFERGYLQAARSAGVPVHWPAVEGAELPFGSPEWEARGDLAGCWSDAVYQLSCALRGVDHREKPLRRNLDRVEHVLVMLYRLAGLQGLDPDTPGLIPWEVWEYRRDVYLSQGWDLPEGHSAEVLEAAEATKTALSAEYDGFGVPSGPEHDSHGHGLSKGHWTCLPEEPE